MSSYDQENSDDELSPLLKIDQESPEEVQELPVQKLRMLNKMAEEKTAPEKPKTKVEKAVENMTTFNVTLVATSCILDIGNVTAHRANWLNHYKVKCDK